MILATIAHAPVLSALHAETFPEEPWSTENFLSLLTQPSVTAWLHEAGGFLLLRQAADEAEILTLGAIPRRQGIARTLLQTAITHAATNHVEKIFLEVSETNTSARALYATFNFTQIGRRQNYYLNGTAALVLSLTL